MYHDHTQFCGKIPKKKKKKKGNKKNQSYRKKKKKKKKKKKGHQTKPALQISTLFP